MPKPPSPPANAMRWVPPQPPLSALIRGIQTRVVANLAVGLNNVLRPPDRRTFGILMYHRIAPVAAGVPAPTINVPPARFRTQLAGLLQRGYEFWPLQRVLEASQAGEPIPSHVVVVTFDDGFECVYTEAVPILRELKIPATIFLATAYLDSDDAFPFDHWGLAYRGRVPASSYRPMRLAQCRELLEQDDLIELGAHTHTHQDFRGRPEVLERDLQKCVEFMRQQLGIERPTFAFPYGTPHLGFADAALVAAARRTGVRCGLTTASALADPATDPFTWGRLHAFPWDSGPSLCARLRGWYSWAPQQQQRLLAYFRQWSPRGSQSPAAEPSAEAGSARAAARDNAEQMESEPRISARPGSPTKPLISIVVPTFNRAHWLGGALASLVNQEPDERFEFEVIVVDNASADNTRDVVDRAAAESSVPIHYLHQSKPGDAPTRNAGVRAARGQYVAFFDDDQFADGRWLSELYSAAQSTQAAIVGGPVLLDLPEAQLQQLGPICRQALREIMFYPKLQSYEPGDLPGTGNALVERGVFERVGTFDESMVSGGSDSDFFLRAREAGCELWYSPRAIIRHRISAERLSPEFFRWDALSGGAGQATQVDFKHRGLPTVLALCLCRVAHTSLVHVPAWLWAMLRGQEGRALGRRTRIWRTEGYVRATLSLLAPRWLAQRAFFASMDFRHGRTLGKPSSSDAALPSTASQGGESGVSWVEQDRSFADVEVER